LFGYLNTQTGSFSSGLMLIMLSVTAGGLLVLRVPAGRTSAELSRL
jgi:hypothetical protein